MREERKHTVFSSCLWLRLVYSYIAGTWVQANESADNRKSLAFSQSQILHSKEKQKVGEGVQAQFFQ